MEDYLGKVGNLVTESLKVVDVELLENLRTEFERVHRFQQRKGQLDKTWNEAVGLACIYTLGFKEGAKNGD